MIPQKLAKLSSFLGFSHYCPICRRFSKQFQPFGEKTRPDAKCPYCGSLERHRLLYLIINKIINSIKKPKLLIHFSPEGCLSSVLRRKKDLIYLTSDLSREDVNFNLDLTNIMLPSNSFDYIICTHILEHIVNHKKALKELKRILKPGGSVFIQVPLRGKKTYSSAVANSPSKRLEIYGQEDHVRIYGSDFKQILKSIGYKVNVINYANKLPKIITSFYKLIPANKKEDLVYICTK